MIVSFMAVDSFHSKDFKLNREHGTNDYLFVNFKSPALLWVENRYVSVDNGSCVLFDKHAKQSYFPNGEIEFLHDFIHFDVESDPERILLESLPKNSPINLLLPSKVTEFLLNIEKEIQVSSDYQKEIVSVFCMAFLYQLKNETDNSNKLLSAHKHYRQLHDLRKEIYKAPHKDWSVDGGSDKVFLSRSYFQHTWKDFFGRTFTDDVIHARISYAQTLLVNGNYSVSKIAEACGYKSTEHFVRQFGKMVGTTPHQYRKRKW
jgi:AraC family transcriptional regulator of arabinose operon